MWSVVVALTTCGCDAQPGADAAVSYARHIAPLINTHCAICHHTDGPGPFPLLGYEEVRARARTILDVIESRYMPPWLPEPGHGVFVGERRLAPQEIDTIRRWVESGMPEGWPSAANSPPQVSDGWQLGAPDLIVTMPVPYQLPATGSDVWRNFVIPVPSLDPRYVKSVELRLGRTRSLHHAVLAVDETATSRRRDAQDPEAGFEGMDLGEAQMPDGHLLGWAPGMRAFPEIRDGAWQLKPRTDLVLQLHMVPSGKQETLQLSIGFHFLDGPARGSSLYVLRLDADEDLDIPPGQKDFRVSDTFEMPADVELLAVWPHAHYIGKSVEASATLSSRTESLIRIADWNFNWQDIYRYAQPVALPKGTRLNVTWGYDNSADNPRNPNSPPKRVLNGNRSSDEMAQIHLQLRLKDRNDRLRLETAYYTHVIQKRPRDARGHYELGNALSHAGRLDQAISQYRSALALDPAHVGSHINIGALLMQMGNVDAAIRELRTAVRLDPDAVGAHFNLGAALAARRAVPEAIRHYLDALRIDPLFVEAHVNVARLMASAGQLDNAIAHAESALKLEPNSGELHNDLGVFLWRSGDVSSATNAFRRAVELDPTNRTARENLDGALSNTRTLK